MSSTRSVIAAHDLIEVIRSDKDRQPARDESLVAADATVGLLPPIRFGRQVLAAQILKAAQPKVRAFTLPGFDVGFDPVPLGCVHDGAHA